MRLYVWSFNKRRTSTTFQIDHIALLLPMLLQCIEGLEISASQAATLDLTLNDDIAILPVLLSNFIFKWASACVAIELGVIDLLQHEAVYVLSEINSLPAVRARVIFWRPLRYARVTAKLVTIQAFFRLLHYLETNRAWKIVVEFGHCLLRLQMLISLDYWH